MSKDLINLMMSSSLKSKGKSLQYEASLYAGEGVGFGGQLLVPDFEKGWGGGVVQKISVAWEDLKNYCH